MPDSPALDPRFFRAYTARASCEAGLFVLLGRPLRPFSAHHKMLLDSLDVALLAPDGEDLDLTTLEVVSLLCSQRCPTGDLSALGQTEYLGLDLARENAVLLAWLTLCVASLPAKRNLIKSQRAGGGTWLSHLPHERYQISYILAHLHGYTRDELLYDYALAELAFEFAAAREIHEEESPITPMGEPVPPESTEEALERGRMEKFAQLILKREQEEIAELGPVKSTADYRAALNAVQARRHDRFALARRGRLAEDLTILHPPEETPAGDEAL